MLMAVLAEQDLESPGGPVWWSTTRFPRRYGVSSATRARGTRELQEAGLLEVERKLMPPTQGKSFSVDRVRSIYRVTGTALLEQLTAPSEPPQQQKAPKRPSPVRAALSPEETSARLRELLEQLDPSPPATVKTTRPVT